MSKFRIKLKLQGLELEVEGSREDAAAISRNIGQQMASLMRPVEGIVNGTDSFESTAETAPPVLTELPSLSRRGRRRKSAASPKANGDASATSIDFKHSPEKFGNPKQQWNTAQKAVWLIYVVSQAANIDELSAGTIAHTFNKHFKQAGTIKTGNVTRDLGKAKVATPSHVGENTIKDPSTWYLTDEGRKRAQALITESLHPSE